MLDIKLTYEYTQKELGVKLYFKLFLGRVRRMDNAANFPALFDAFGRYVPMPGQGQRVSFVSPRGRTTKGRVQIECRLTVLGEDGITYHVSPFCIKRIFKN